RPLVSTAFSLIRRSNAFVKSEFVSLSARVPLKSGCSFFRMECICSWSAQRLALRPLLRFRARCKASFSKSKASMREFTLAWAPFFLLQPSWLPGCRPVARPAWIRSSRFEPNELQTQPNTFMNDIRFALRQVLKSPGFTLVAVLTLALGIGLNTAIFSLINDLFLKGLPFQEPERVLHILTKGKDRTDQFQMSAPRFMLYRDGQTIFSGFAAENQEAATVTGLGDPLSVPIFKATANWFDVLGVRPIMGRTFLPQEEEGADVAIITDRFWRARFAGSQDIIGKTIMLDGVAHTIVGVIANMPVSWTETPNANIWTTKPMAIPGFSHERMMRGSAFLRVIGRLKAGVTLDQAKAVLGTLEDSYSSQFPEKSDAQNRNIIKTLPEDVTENLRPGFATLLTAVGFVLLIACSNVANLLLVRFSGRRREISLRLALGATRGSILRLFVFESVLISLLAGVLGAALAWQLVPLVPKLAANFLPI